MGVLDGKVIIVTGAAGGIGKECALLAAREGAKVVVNDLGGSVAGGDEGDAGPAEKTAQEIKTAGGEAVHNSDSVSNMAGVKAMVEQAKDSFGGLHGIINPAGILRDKMFHKMDDADWDAVIEVHLRGAYNVSRASIELFRDQQDGAYVHFTSTSGLIGNIGQANYAAAKLGVMGLSRIIAMEGALKNVRSNIIAPFAWTRMIATIPVKDEAGPSVSSGSRTPCAPIRSPSSPSPCARIRQKRHPARSSPCAATRWCCSTSRALCARWPASRAGRRKP